MAGYLGTGGSTPGVRGAGQRFGFFLTVKGTIESCKGMSFEAKPNKPCDKGFGL